MPCLLLEKEKAESRLAPSATATAGEAEEEVAEKDGGVRVFESCHFQPRCQQAFSVHRVEKVDHTGCPNEGVGRFGLATDSNLLPALTNFPGLIEA